MLIVVMNVQSTSLLIAMGTTGKMPVTLSL